MKKVGLLILLIILSALGGYGMGLMLGMNSTYSSLEVEGIFGVFIPILEVLGVLGLLFFWIVNIVILVNVFIEEYADDRVMSKAYQWAIAGTVVIAFAFMEINYLYSTSLILDKILMIHQRLL